jgi:S-adenosylmethionine/arginine decarboxylase-like enzyme
VIESAPAITEQDRGLTGFGLELQLELAGCDPRVINSRDELAIWATLLAEHIGMTTYKGPVVDHFGEGALAGITVYQRITTSNILVHAVEADNSAFINVFSCRAFDPDLAIAFTVKFFQARAHDYQTRARRAPEVKLP